MTGRTGRYHPADERSTMSEPQSTETPEVVETRGDERVDLLTSDANGDGKIDVWVSDTDGDGKPDLYQFDTDGDGKVDVTMVDLDEDGNPDHIVDGDGGLPPVTV
ncbi:hypothetical protein GCM10009828_007340 [Actinoplanes couchii]|uniref:Uncharacterized protein n=2 Tax=Actinoplanes couchii TaxID=403638 RepID=A0ABQ3XJM8_9ACTN|nr:hypothetical protein Aco03nite_070910 [Actinoplanes couchii]